jgi:serine/threonine protein kinase/WD40 repeat protein/tetratricopeptide (TPR) repeat protein
MTPSQAERNPIDELAEEFAERYRRGERPPLSEYIRKHPELAEEIREVFPALVMMEQLKPATSDEVPVLSPGSLPDRIGDYRLLRQIGWGGMGIVYEAEQVSLGRHVALKVFPATGLTNPTYLERFRREAKAAARLHHTNIVPVFGVGESAGVHYYAMQFIHGEGMDKVLADLRRLRPKAAAAAAAEQGVAYSLLSGKFAVPLATHSAPPALAGVLDAADAANEPAASSATLAVSPANKPSEEPVNLNPSTVTLSGSTSGTEYHRSIARIGLQVAEALGYAHKQGILHRDIKPSNLILDLQGTVWITDFGLAKADDADELTHTGDVVGTIRYMPPERFEGSSLPQGDIYAVGMTLYEMLTLRPAFDGANHARLIQRIGREVPPRPRRLVPDIPRDLETIVLKAGARDPADRYATAEALAEDLQRFLSDRPIRARRHAAAERLWRWCRRNPAVAGLMGAIAALLIAVAIGSSFAAFSLNASKREALEQLWRSKLSEARATVLSRQPGQRFTSLKRIREAMAIATKLGMTEGDRLELRNAAIAALGLPDFEVEKEWDSWPEGSSGLDFDAKLERYACSNKDCTVSIRRLSDDRELFALPSMGQPASMRFSPSGRHLVVCNGSEAGPLKVWELGGLEPRCIHEGTSLNSAFIDFSPDHGQLAYETPNQLTIVDLATGQKQASWRLSGTPWPCGLRWNPKSNQLAVGRKIDGKWLVEIRDSTTGAVVVSLPPTAAYCSSFTWHPDGRRLAVGEGDKISFWDVPSRQRVAVLEGHKNMGIFVRFNQAGDRMISGDWSGALRLWDVASGQQILTILGVGFASFAPDDGSLACVRNPGKVQILRFAPGREMRTLGRNPAGETILNIGDALRLSRDGQLLAISAVASRLRDGNGLAVLDRWTGQTLADLAVCSQRPLGFGPDGSLWTFGLGGDVLCWPRTVSNGTIRFGPPQPVVSVPGTEARAMSADGSTVLLGNFHQGGLILHRGACERLIPTGPQEDVRYGALSPDGLWAATGSHWSLTGPSAKVWDAATGRLEKQFSVGGPCSVDFSPNGRWLVTRASSVRLWRTGTWEEGPRLQVSGDGWNAAFSPDSRLLALGGLGRVRLVRPDTGAEVARLTLSEQTSLFPLCFTPDGAELVVRGEDTQAIHVWDLRLIRAQLAELGLDWDDPPLPPESKKPDVAPTVEFVGADLVADVHKLRQYRMTLNLLALSADPFDARAHFRLAQMSDDPAAAVAHYTASLTFAPKQPLAHENRAAAAFKLKRWKQVVADTDQVLKDHPDRARALYLRAAAHQRLEQHAQAVADITALLAAYPRDTGLYDLRAHSYQALGKKELAAADRRKAEELAPDDPARLNARAWLLLTGPPAERDAQAALKLAQRAVDLTPNDAMHVNTLGVAQYRNGQCREALATFQRSLALGNGRWDAFDLFFLAMCHQKLGKPKEAKDCFDRAVSWVAAQKNLTQQHVEELRAFQAEAQAELRTSAAGPKQKN